MRVPGQKSHQLAQRVGMALLALPALAMANADVEKNIANPNNWSPGCAPAWQSASRPLARRRAFGPGTSRLGGSSWLPTYP